jgi:hypothetical protein
MIHGHKNFSEGRQFFFKFNSLFLRSLTVVVAQLVRASDCGSEGRRFEPGHPPFLKSLRTPKAFSFENAGIIKSERIHMQALSAAAVHQVYC